MKAYVNADATRSVYHTNPDCQYLRDGAREWRLEIARAWYRECEACKQTRETPVDK